MKVRRTGRFKVKTSHPDYKTIKVHTIEAKEIYNYANYIIRQIYFKNSENHEYSMGFIHEYPELNEDFEIYLKESKQFTSIFYRIICNFSRIKEHSLNSKMVQNVVDVLKRDEYTCKSARALWKNNEMYMEIIYEKEVPEKKVTKKVASIDLGGKILMSVAYNFNRRGICILANMLRSLNHYYNKVIGTMTSILPKGISR